MSEGLAHTGNVWHSSHIINLAIQETAASG